MDYRTYISQHPVHTGTYWNPYNIFSWVKRRFRIRIFPHSPALKIVLLLSVAAIALLLLTSIRERYIPAHETTPSMPLEVDASSQDLPNQRVFKIRTFTNEKSRTSKFRRQFKGDDRQTVQDYPSQNRRSRNPPIEESYAQTLSVRKSGSRKFAVSASHEEFPYYKRFTHNSPIQKRRTRHYVAPDELDLTNYTEKEAQEVNRTFVAESFKIIADSTVHVPIITQNSTNQTPEMIQNSTTEGLNSTLNSTTQNPKIIQNPEPQNYSVSSSTIEIDEPTENPTTELPSSDSTQPATTEQQILLLNITTGLSLIPLDLEDFPQIVDLYRSGNLNESLAKPINLRYSSVNFSVNPSLNSSPQKINLLIVVKSARTNYWKRNIVRQTWGNRKYLEENTLNAHNISTRVYFILGQSDRRESDVDSYLRAESVLQKDLIIANFNDSYLNNTYKSLAAFKWALTEFNGEFKFFALVDDDVFVDMLNLAATLRDLKYKRVLKLGSPTTGFPYFQITPRQDDSTIVVADISNGLYIGNCRFSSPPMRNFGKWPTSFEDYPYHMFPPYVPGAGMVFDYKATSDIYYGSPFVRHFWIDDVFIGIVAAKLGIIPFHEDYTLLNVFHGFLCPEQILDFWQRRDKRFLANCPT